jgi:hypothetical protein
MRVYAAESLSALDQSLSALIEPHPHHHIIAVIEMFKTEVLVEADSALVACVYSEMDTGNSPGSQVVEKTAHHRSPHASPLQDGEEIDVEMGRISGHDFVGWALRIVDQGDDLGVVVRRIFSDRLGVARSQRRPPPRLAFGLESPGINGGQDIPGRGAFLDRGETDPARHHQVGPDVDLTEETAVHELGARVLPGVTGAKTDLVKGIEICWLDRTDQHVLPGRIWRRTGPAGANLPCWSA